MNAPEKAMDAVLVSSEPIPKDTPTVKGYDFNNGIDYEKILQSYLYTGYQATHLGEAIQVIDSMITTKKEGEKCKIYLGYTSNLVSSGLRETIRYLVEHKMVDCIVTTAGGIEEDFIKCLGPTFLGEFALDGATLRKKGLNRIGNLLVPNDNYCKFEDWVVPILDQLLQEQTSDGIVWSPSKIIRRLGKEINNEESIYYWAYRNDIPVYSPALTDGSLGDMIYFHSYKNPGLVIDLVQDIRAINDSTVFAKHTGMIILGGGLIKHHICNANLMVNEFHVEKWC
jgi:deoxyhypusine synthase